MAFDARSFDPGASSKGAPNQASYGTTVDNIATVEGAGYFNSMSGPLTSAFASGKIFVVASDGSVIYGYTIAAGVVTLDVANKEVID